MNSLLFRADGNAQIGMGHIMRCLALAEMLKNDFTIRFAITEPTSPVRALIKSAGITLLELPKSSERASFLAQIRKKDIVVLDGYGFDEMFQRAIRVRAKKLVFIDDLINGYQVADVVINHAGSVQPSDYEAEPYTQFYLGPHYALLRPEFLNPEGFGTSQSPGQFHAGQFHAGNAHSEQIFVNLGGADPQNTSLMVLEAIQQADATLPVHLILGPFHPNRAAIEAFAEQLPNLSILQNLSAAQIASELQQCSLAITACSTIAYEVCAINRPLIAVVTADNQDRLARFLSEERLTLSVNFPTLLTRSIPVIALDKLIRLSIQSFLFSSENVDETLANQRRFFDGRSPERLRNVFQGLST